MEVEVATPCTAHHWLIEPPDGPTSEGTCMWCGQTKTFNNGLKQGLQGSDWKDYSVLVTGRPPRGEV